MKISHYCLATLLAFIHLFATYVSAGGIILYEISSADTRLGTAGWSSRAEDPSTVFTNPAGMTRFSHPAVELGGQAINAHIVFDPNAETTVRGSNGNATIWTPAGSLFYVHPLNENIVLGYGSVGYFGADLGYNKNWVGRYYVTHSFLEGFSAVPAAAYRINDCLSIGLGVNVMCGLFRQKSAINNALDSMQDGQLKLHDIDFAAGVVAGILYEISPCTRVGIQYLSPVKLTFRDTPKFEGIGPLLEEALRISGILNSTVHVNARVPQNVIISIYHAINPCWSVMADAGWQQWSRFQKVSVSLSDPSATTLTSKIKYLDTWHFAAGVEYHYNPCWIFSGGFAYDSSAISSKERPLDFPIGKQWRFGSGARWYYSDNFHVDLCYELQWSGNLPANVNKGRLLGHVDGKFRNVYVQYFNIDLTWAF